MPRLPHDEGPSAPQIDSVEIYEETDGDRWLGTFHLYLEDGTFEDGSIGDEPDDDWPDEELDSEGWERWNAAQDASAEARAQADPHQRLSIDDAIALARSYSGRVTVWLDNERWSAGAAPLDGLAPWPPPDLDLRPREMHEPPTSARSNYWRVSYTINANGLTPEIAREAVEGLPHVVAVSSAEERIRSRRRRWWPPRFSSSARRRDESTTVDVVCITGPSPLGSEENEALMRAVGARTVPVARPLPAAIRLKVLWNRLLRRPMSYWVTTSGSRVSPSVIGPVSDEEVAGLDQD